MSERQRGRATPPPQEPAKEREPPEPYYQAARYPGEEGAGIVYDQAQELIFTTPNDLSAFRLNLSTGWHVAILGVPPPPELAQQINKLLSTGEPALLPDNILTMLYQRRARATQLGPWVEGHYRPGMRFKRRKP